jgi:hypothetical protein
MAGGADKRLNRRLSWRLVEADYMVTTFDNTSNNHQKKTRLSSGIVIHF